MHRFLSKQKLQFEIFIVNQKDDYRFNRGALLNVGFLTARERSDYVAMHDVDLMPLNDELSYDYPHQPFHVASPALHPIYHYKNFIGGIFLMNRDHFERVNGLAHDFWGWGREDDEMFIRIGELGLTIERPNITSSGQHNTFKHLHDGDERVRDMMKGKEQWEASKRRHAASGFNSTEYHVVEKKEIFVEGYPYTRVDVELVCHLDITPYCLHAKGCETGYYRDKRSKICRLCSSGCWDGFVLVGNCTEANNPKCMKIGRDISPEEAKQWPQHKRFVIYPP